MIDNNWTTDRFLSPTEQKHGGFNEVVSPSPLHIHTYDKNNVSKFTKMQRNIDMRKPEARKIFQESSIIYLCHIYRACVGGCDLANQILFMEGHKTELVLANNRLGSLNNNPI